MPREVQNKVLDLLEACGAVLRREDCPTWLVRPGSAECGAAWGMVCEAYTDLTGMTLPETMPPRERRSLDALWLQVDGVERVVEVDEAQHFNPHRARTFAHYNDVSVAYDVERWAERSRESIKMRGGGWGKPKPPLFPHEDGRHRQRAFRDLLADVLPPRYGWAPTLRIAHFEVEEWLHAADAVDRMRLLVESKAGVSLS